MPAFVGVTALLTPITLNTLSPFLSPYSLYLHYPFCIKRCPYCGFATAVEKEDLAVRYREVLLAELKRRLEEEPWKGRGVKTIYFGGGTPSLMPPEYVGEVIGVIQKAVIGSKGSGENPPLPPPSIEVGDVRPCAGEDWPDREPSVEVGKIEVTLEANPETRDVKAFKGFHKAGVNRISMGAQSFDPEELKVLGRAHSAGGVFDAVRMAREAGFENISLDLIYGVPGQTVESFRRSVEACLSLGIEHLSAYTLSIEEGTPFQRSVREKRLPYPDPDLMADQYAVLVQLMNAAGFDHYELTNYAKPGYYSRHNSAYWDRSDYLGVGNGAHSFCNGRRFWNRRDTRAHILEIMDGRDPTEGDEVLSTEQVIEETVYLRLRTKAGLTEELIEGHLNSKNFESLLKAGFLVADDERWVVAEDKWLMLDDIVLRLMAE